MLFLYKRVHRNTIGNYRNRYIIRYEMHQINYNWILIGNIDTWDMTWYDLIKSRVDIALSYDYR